MKSQQTRTHTKRRRSWRTLVARHRSGMDADGSLAEAVVRTTVLVRHLERRAGDAALKPLLADLEQVRGGRAQRLRVSLAQLRERVVAIRAAAEAGREADEATLRQVREIEGRMHEAHWLARQAAQRATASAMDLQRLCAVTSDVGGFIDVLLGLGAQASELAQGRRIAA